MKDLIIGDWRNGVKSNYNNLDFDDTSSEARFLEKQELDVKNSTNKKKVYVTITVCEIKTPLGKDIFTALIKKNSEKWEELTTRFPAAWDNFCNYGGGWKEPVEVAPSESVATENTEQSAPKRGRPKKTEIE